MGEHVAVVEPAARVVLDELCGHRVARPEGDVVDHLAGGVGPAVAVDVEGVEGVVDPVDVEGDPLADARLQGGGVARVRPPVQAAERLVEVGRRRGERVHEDEEVLVGSRHCRIAHDQRPEQALEHRQRVHRPVVVVHPRPGGPRPRLPDVLEGPVLLDEAAGVGELALVGPVHLLRVEDPVRVDAHRRPQLVLEVDHHRVTDVGLDQRAGNRPRAERRLEVRRVGAVDVGVELGLALDLLVHHLVLAGGDDVPALWLGPDPVLAPRGRAVGRQHRLTRGGPGPGLGRLHPRRNRDVGRQLLDVGAAIGEHPLAGERAQEQATGAGEELATAVRIEVHGLPLDGHVHLHHR
jgi:hypothetical protein